MIYYDRIDFSEGIDVNKINKSKECNICHSWYSLNKGFKFQPNVCNGCHDFLIISMNLTNIAILNIKSADYRCIISGISRREAINLMQNIDLTEKRETNYKYFIGYLYKPLHIMLPKTNAYVKSYDEQTKRMFFLIEDDELLEK